MPAVPAGIFIGCVCGSVAGLLSGRQKNPVVQYGGGAEGRYAVGKEKGNQLLRKKKVPPGRAGPSFWSVPGERIIPCYLAAFCA